MKVYPKLGASLAVVMLLIVFAIIVSNVDKGSTSTECPGSGSSATQIRQLNRASPNGSSDNSLWIQQAIDAAAQDGGGIVQLSAGQYDLDRPLRLKSNVALRGAGQSTLLKASLIFLSSQGPYGGHPLITTDGASDVTISQLTADQSGDVLNGNVSGRLNEYLIDVRHTTNALVEKVFTKNPFTYSIAVVASSHFCIRNNNTLVTTSGKYNQLDGIHIMDSNYGVVEDNHVDQRQGSDGDDGLVAQSIGSPVHDIVYRDNDVRGGSHGSGMQIAVGEYEIYNITVSNNRFWGSPLGIKTGYYDGGYADVHDVKVSDNKFVDIHGASVDIYGQLENIVVINNVICRSGDVKLEDGPGNRVI